MSVKKARYEIEIAVNPYRDSGGDDFDDTESEGPHHGICGSVFFSPASRILRGAYDPALLTGVSISSEMQKFFERTRSIPGERVWVDLRKNEWGTYDPLYKPETPALERKAARVNEAMKMTFTNGRDVSFVKPASKKITTDDEAKNVIYWMARLVENKKAHAVPGSEEIPSVEEAKAMPGRRDATQGFRQQDKETNAAFDSYSDYVPSAASQPSK